MFNAQNQLASLPSPALDAAADLFAADEVLVRHDLVLRLRRQLELGIYDEDRRIDTVVDRMMADLQDI